MAKLATPEPNQTTTVQATQVQHTGTLEGWLADGRPFVRTPHGPVVGEPGNSPNTGHPCPICHAAG
jgi:hypothetical protein